MKKAVWHITLASLLTLVAYLALYAIWGALLRGVENPTLRLFLIALMTTVAFGFFLLYTAKIRHAVGEEEVISDYRDAAYTSLWEDAGRSVKRERGLLICIAVIVLLCFALNTLDALIFEKKTISHPTFLFAPMCLFGSMFNGSILGYALSAVLDGVTYMVFLLLYRKKKYSYWMRSRR